MYSYSSQRGYWCCQSISQNEEILNDQMRLLWSQHVYWTRLFISGTIFDSPDVKVTEARLLQNPGDMAMVLAPFYGERAARRFEELFTAHLTIAGQLVNAAKAGDDAAVTEAEKRWYENAGQIAQLLASINPYWTVEEWKEMLYDHLAMTKQEATEFITKKYQRSVETFDMIEQQAMEMADRMTWGIVEQFPNAF